MPKQDADAVNGAVDGVGNSPVAPLDPEPTPPPHDSFATFPIDDSVKQALAEMGYAKPTDVQVRVVDPAMAGSDLLVQSKTGSGKTSAFGIPLVALLAPQAAEPNRPQALVLLPTRELAHQVAAELERLAKFKKTVVLSVYGGVPMGRQVQALQAGVDIVVATPGRLLDHVRRGNIRLDRLKTIVLDEADEMLSMGFWDDVTELIKLAPVGRQTLMFSATLPYEIAKSATQFMRETVRLDLSGDDLTVDGIENCIVHVISGIPKPRQMLYVLEGAKADSAIIFCNTRNETEILAKYLTQSGFVAEPLSGNFKQKERERTMARIKGGELRYMVATDIAARGIDINDLSHVFNYSLPEFCEVYLHRVGRTGRIGKLGKAISLVDGKGLGTLSVLERQFGISFREMTLPPEDEVIRARSQRIMQELLEKANMAELSQHLPVAQSILDDGHASQMVAFLLKAYFNGQANGAERMAVAQAAHPPRVQAAEAPKALTAKADSEQDTDQDEDQAQAADGEQASQDEDGPRRRRRRRGRGRSAQAGSEVSQSRDGEGDAEQSAPRAPGRSATAAAGSSLPYEIVDASEWLGGEPTKPAAAPARRAEPRAQAQDNRGNRGGRAERNDSRGNDRGERGNDRGERGNDRGERGNDRGERGNDRGENSKQPAAAAVALPEGQCRIKVNIGFDDGFKGRGSVAKKIAALAGLNEGILTEMESRRDHAVLRASQEIAELVLDRVDGAQVGKKVMTVTLG